MRDIEYKKSYGMRTYGTRPHYTKEMFEKRKEKVLESSLYKELQGYQKAGLSLWLNGRPSTSYGIANYVREESDYMRDYRFNGDNEVCGIGFDRIRKREYGQKDSNPGFPEQKT